ncbi:MAG: aldo/keto reductase [Frankiales bacterium]|nr:aldo/keto reductase [Frankiales bacterium]
MRHLSIPLLTAKPVPAVGIGAMPLSDGTGGRADRPRDEAIGVLHHAFDVGLTLVDTADIYAPDGYGYGHNEELVGEAVRTWSGGRDALVVVTKIGITRAPGADGGPDVWGRDGSREHLLAAAEASVSRLGLVPDAILLHRVNREQQPFATTVENLLAVREAGFAPVVGIGNVHLDECLVAWDVSGGTVAAVENERSPRYREDLDVLRWAIEHGVAYFPWSPLGGGDEARDLGRLHPEFAAVAAEVSASSGTQVSAQQVALAWLRAAGSTVVPIPGSTRAATTDASAAAADVELSAEQVARLDASPVGAGSVFPDDED